MEYSSVSSPVWANADQTAIDCQVTFSEYGQLPFTASPNDTTDYGKEIFNNCVAGLYGTVGAYTPPQQPDANVTQGTQTL